MRRHAAADAHLIQYGLAALQDGDPAARLLSCYRDGGKEAGGTPTHYDGMRPHMTFVFQLPRWNSHSARLASTASLSSANLSSTVGSGTI